MVGCQDATDGGVQSDLPAERPGTAKVVNAQILAGGYTKGLLLHELISALNRKSWFGDGIALSKCSLVKSVALTF